MQPEATESAIDLRPGLSPAGSRQNRLERWRGCFCAGVCCEGVVGGCRAYKRFASFRAVATSHSPPPPIRRTVSHVNPPPLPLPPRRRRARPRPGSSTALAGTRAGSDLPAWARDLARGRCRPRLRRARAAPPQASDNIPRPFGGEGGHMRQLLRPQTASSNLKYTTLDSRPLHRALQASSATTILRRFGGRGGVAARWSVPCCVPLQSTIPKAMRPLPWCRQVAA